MGRPSSMADSDRPFELVRFERILKVDQFPHTPPDDNFLPLHDGHTR